MSPREVHAPPEDWTGSSSAGTRRGLRKNQRKARASGAARPEARAARGDGGRLRGTPRPSLEPRVTGPPLGDTTGGLRRGHPVFRGGLQSRSGGPTRLRLHHHRRVMNLDVSSSEIATCLVSIAEPDLEGIVRTGLAVVDDV